MMSTSNPVGVIILAGGKSSRMGTDKSLLRLPNGNTFIESILKTATSHTQSIVVVSNSEDHHRLGIPVFKDLANDKGPMMGIYTGLINSKKDQNIILTCDMPNVSDELIQYLIDKSTFNETASIIKHKNNLEPLCGVYSKECIPVLKKILSENRLSLQKALPMLDAKILDITHESFYSKRLLMNVNTPADFDQFRTL
jgi:molybdopterin-guanine dinucleotide biosynthesis protein A